MAAWWTTIHTDSGDMPAYVARAEGDSAQPLVIMYMDALGIRAELEAMAERIAAAGYCVMLPNLFYRDGGPSFDPRRLPAYIDPEMERLNVETTMAMVAADTRALLRHAGDDPRTIASRAGVVGYCMGGRHAMTAAATFPDAIRAAASIHGGRLVTSAADSVHRRLREIGAEVYFAFADRDQAAPAEHLDTIRAELRRHGNRGLAERLDALHGFAFPERYCYDEAAAEHCWSHWFAMLARNLGPASAADGAGGDA